MREKGTKIIQRISKNRRKEKSERANEPRKNIIRKFNDPAL